MAGGIRRSPTKKDDLLHTQCPLKIPYFLLSSLGASASTIASCDSAISSCNLLVNMPNPTLRATDNFSVNDRLLLRSRTKFRHTVINGLRGHYRLCDWTN
jgi:hypothetical protein